MNEFTSEHTKVKTLGYPWFFLIAAYTTYMCGETFMYLSTESEIVYRECMKILGDYVIAYCSLLNTTPSTEFHPTHVKKIPNCCVYDCGHIHFFYCTTERYGHRILSENYFL